MKPRDQNDLVDSGVVWIGAIPQHWVVKPLKHVASFQNGCAFKPTEWSDDGIPIIRIENLNGGDDFNFFDGTVDPRFHIYEGSLLFGWSGNRGTSFGPFWWRRRGLHYLNQHIFKVSSQREHQAWLYWALRAVTFYVEEEAHGIIGMVHVTKGRLGAIPIPVPSLAEQHAIAAFLDRETARIDGLIAKKRRLIKLLREKRQAVISHAVTEGLDPDAPMKDSGIEWLGDVPAHWEVMRMKYCTKRIEQGWSPDCENRLAEPGEWAVLKVGCVNNGVFRPDEHKALPPDLDPRSALEVRAGQLLMSRANTTDLVGQVAIVPPGTSRLMLCDKLYRIETERGKVNTKFLAYVLRSDGSRLQLMSEATGASSSMQNIGQDTVKNCLVGVPPIEEQNKISRYLDQHQSEVERAEQITERAILKLEEHRAALIAAAVTGKIDVRAHRADAVEAAD